LRLNLISNSVTMLTVKALACFQYSRSGDNCGDNYFEELTSLLIVYITKMLFTVHTVHIEIQFYNDINHSKNN